MRYIQFNFRPHIRTLDDLILEARAYTHAALEVAGSVRPTLLAVSPRGVFAHYPEKLTSEADKELFALECRLLLTATRATMCAMILESWMADIRDGKIPSTLPSQTSNRREVVTVCAESREAEHFLIFPICRYGSGHFRELGESSAPEGLEAIGRFAQMLPVNPPREKEVEAAWRTLGRIEIELRDERNNFSDS